MIETALLGTQPSTQPGTLTGPSTTRQAGAPEMTDPFGTTSVMPAHGGLISSLAPVAKGTFRKSLEELTGPIVPGQGTSGLPTQPTDTLAKSSLVQHSDLLSSLSNVRRVVQDPAGVSPSQAGAQDALQAGVESMVPRAQVGTGDATQPRLAAGPADLTSIEARTVSPSSTLKPVSSHAPKMTVIAASPLTANEAAAESTQATQPAQSTQAPTPLIVPTQGSLASLPEQTLPVQADDLSTAGSATYKGDASVSSLPDAVPGFVSATAAPVRGKEITTKPIELKSNRLAGKGLATASSAPAQPSAPSGDVVTAPQPTVIAGANDRTPDSAPATPAAAQPAHSIFAAPITSAPPVPLLTAGLGAHSLEASTNPSKDPSATAQTPVPAGTPATFAQVFETEAPSAPAIQRPSPVGAAEVSVAAAATHPPAAAQVQTPAPEKSGPEKSGPEKSSQLSDPYLPGDPTASAASSALHSTSLPQIAEPAQASMSAIPHLPPAASLVPSGPTDAATPVSGHPLSALLHDSSAALSDTSASDGSGFAQHTTLQSTPNVLEVGVASGSHGWLKVRAELDGSGGVSASVIANTPAAAVTMHKELPALSAYLSSESVGVSSLVVNQAGAANQTLSGGGFYDTAMNPGAGMGGGGTPREQPQLSPPPGAPVAQGASGEGIDGISLHRDGPLLPSFHAGPGEGVEAGSWLSVRA